MDTGGAGGAAAMRASISAVGDGGRGGDRSEKGRDVGDGEGARELFRMSWRREAVGVAGEGRA